jgi:hypothetical protein
VRVQINGLVKRRLVAQDAEKAGLVRKRVGTRSGGCQLAAARLEPPERNDREDERQDGDQHRDVGHTRRLRMGLAADTNRNTAVAASARYSASTSRKPPPLLDRARDPPTLRLTTLARGHVQGGKRGGGVCSRSLPQTPMGRPLPTRERRGI